VVLTPADGFDAARLERLGLLVGGAEHPEQPTLAYGHLPGHGSVLSWRGPGRAGSAEVDVVLLADGVALPAGVLPIDAWCSAAWSAAAGNRFALLPSTDPARLVQFARAVGDRLVSVLADLRGLFAAAAGPQILLAEPDPGNVACWIALLSASLPPALAHRLSFTTSTARPHEACQQVLGIAPATAGGLSEDELRHTYRVRAATGPRSPEASEPWAEITARLWLAGLPGLINDESRIPAAEPFDAGRLAVVALLAGIAPTGPDAALAAEWMARAETTGTLADADIEALMLALPKLCASGGVPEAARGAFARLSRRATEDVAGPVALELGRATLEAALADPAAVREDPLASLNLRDYTRNRLATEFGERLRAAMDPGLGLDVARLRGGLVLAGAVLRSPDEVFRTLARTLTDHLVDGASPGGDAAQSIVDVLEELAQPQLSAAIVTHLEQRALTGDAGRLAAFVANPVGARLLTRRRRELDRAPVLRAVLATRTADEAQLRGFRRFAVLWDAADRGEGAPLLRALWDLAWPGATALPVTEAVGLARLLPNRLLRTTELGGRAFESLDKHANEHPDLALLTEITLALDRYGALPGPLLDELAKRFAGAGDEFFDPKVVDALTRCCGGELLARYGRQHRRPDVLEGLATLLRERPAEAAGRFSFWTELAADQDPRARALGTELIGTFIVPALRDNGDGWVGRVDQFLLGRDRARNKWRTEHRAAQPLPQPQPQPQPQAQGDDRRDEQEAPQ
jgi:hypothetical protein